MILKKEYHDYNHHNNSVYWWYILFPISLLKNTKTNKTKTQKITCSEAATDSAAPKQPLALLLLLLLLIQC